MHVLPEVRNVHQQVWVGLGTAAIVALCAYPVFKTDQRPGHDLFSSEKPEAVLVAQEAKRQEYRRQIKQQRKQMKQDQELLRQKKSQQEN